MAAFAEQIDDGPVIVPALEMLQGKLSGFRAPQPAPEQHAENCTVTFADQRSSIWATEQVFRLFRTEPVAQRTHRRACRFNSQRLSSRHGTRGRAEPPS